MSLPRLTLTALPFLALTFGAPPALAHAGHEHGLVAGFLHPLMGADHVAAMVAIGLWVASIGWRRGWLPPLGFLAGMAGGIALALTGGVGLGFGFVETAVAGSLIVLGAMLAMAQPFRPARALPLVLVAGLVHGLAHGGEIGGAAAATAFGMLAGSALLHGLGVALGVASARYAGALRFGGAATAALGVVLFLA
ncbi:MAG: HupE/UreJ family protein [Roseomonas sp.]|nr:HupE/UreJ family protein [Roseomonas sp.]